ncbi:phage tail protein [Mycolicibacterium senegalense]|uniref:phage tail protein n=1 Tax=Mycolicibacterium TaxID=1866885 RepID=UPI003204A3B8
MPDYSLGRAHGKIEITYDGSGAGKAVKDLDSVAASSTTADKSLSKTQKTLKDTDRQFDTTGDAAHGYSARLKEVRQASDDVDNAQRNLNATLLDSKATADDVEAAYRRMEEASKRHAKAVDAERDAHRALTDRMSVSQRVMSSLSDIIPNLSRNIERLGAVQDDVSDKTTGLARTLGVAAKAAAFFGPQGKAAAAGLTLAADGIDKLGDSAKSGSGFISGFVKEIAGFELAVGKVGAIAMGIPSLGGLAGLGGAAGVQGIINIAGAARQLSGVLGLLPAVAAGVGFSMQTLEVAFHGVGDALTDMMADDPKKFLEDIKNMGPAAAEAMLGIAQFRDEFKLAGGAVQDSFFTKIAADIAPLIQTWLPLIAGGMSQVSGIFGQAAHELASLLETPAAVQSFSAFIENISAGLRAMLPAIQPLFGIFQQLIVVGSSFFEQIGGRITDTLTALVGLIGQATSDGSFQAWIQSAINGFGHLVDIVINVTQAFGNIMTIADQFGGGGLLGWLDEMAIALNNWTQSTEGQQALTDFFSTVREATNAFLPMLGPLVNGLASIGTAFVQLGVATAPGWQVFFDTFAQSMAQLAPQIVALAPALNQFLLNMAGAFADLINQVGPELPNMFVLLSNAFRELLPQIGPIVDVFLDLANRVGPQLPKLFSAVTDALIAITPYIPIVVDLFRNLVSAVTLGIEAFTGLVEGLGDFLKWIGDMPGKVDAAITRVIDVIGNLFDLSDDAKGWGKNIVTGLIDGLLDAAGLGALAGAAKSVVEGIAGWFQHSPAKWGPFSGDGYTKVRGQQMVQDMADGMRAAQGTISAAASSTAAAASSALGIGGGAPAAGGAAGLGGALLPAHIAGADNSVLSAYLRHEFSDTRGLKGFAKDMGNILDAAESGFNLLSQNIAGTMFQALGMIPALNTRPWVKMSPEQIAAQEQNELQRKAIQDGKKDKPSWTDVFGPGAAGTGTSGADTPLGLSASSSKADIQKAIIAAGRARGMSDSAIQTALAVAAAESNFNPTISGGVQGSAGLVSGLFQQSPSSGWGTLEQVNDPNHAINAFYDAYAKELEKNPQDPMLAAVLTQNPQLGSGAKGSDYWDAVSAKLGLGSQIMNQLGKDVKGPTWSQITGINPMTGTTGIKPMSGANGYTTDEALLASVPAGRYTQSQDVDLTQGLADCSSAVEDLVNLIDGAPTGGRAMSTHNADQWLSEHGFLPGKGSLGDFRVGFNPSHMQATLPGGTPFNWGSDEAAARRGIGGTGADDPAFTSHYYRPIAVGGSGSGIQLMLPSGKSAEELLDTTDKNLSVNEQLLQAYLQGNPALAAQIDAAKTPGASDDSVLSALTGIDSTITDLKTQDAVGNKNTIDALQSTQSQIARDAGFQQGKTALSTAQSAMSGAANAVTGVFKVITSTLDAVAATQDIADRLVYGVRNTEDVMKIIDNVQTYVELAANVANATGSILSTIGGLVGAGGGSDPSGGAAGASMALSAAGQISQLIGAALQGVNMAINFAQDVYHIAGTYVGRFLSQLTAGIGGTPLMGDVRFLLNKNTGQLITYSEDNPGNKNSLNVPSWMNQTYDYGGGSNPNPQVNTQWNIYAGPGQSPGEMLNETMWMVNTAGTSGAMQAANF